MSLRTFEEVLMEPSNPSIDHVFPPKEEVGRKGVVRPLSVRERIFLTLANPTTSWVGVCVAVVVVALIVLSCVMLVIETMPELHEYSDECALCKPSRDERDTTTIDYCVVCDGCAPSSPSYFFWVELMCVVVFTMEYGLRVSTCTSLRSERETAQGRAAQDLAYCYPESVRPWFRLRDFLVDPLNIIDLLSIAPFWVEMVAGQSAPNFTFLRALRLLRIFRMFRIGSLSLGAVVFFRVFQKSFIGIVTLFIFVVLGMFVLGSLIFYAEQGTWDPATGEYLRDPLYYLDEKEPSPYTSIPNSFWWVLVTFTTVGYGDMSPTTAWGQIVGVVCMYLGIFLITMPITLIGSHFSHVWEEINELNAARDRKLLAQGEQLYALFTLADTIPMRQCWGRWHTATVRAMEAENDVDLRVRAVLDKFGVLALLSHGDKSRVVEVESVRKEVEGLRQELNAGVREVRELIAQARLGAGGKA